MMSDEMQLFINSALGIIAFLGGVVMKVVWDAVGALRVSLAEMRQEDAALAAKVQSIEVLVAGQYVKRDEFERLSHALFVKLDQIMEKLDSKVNRIECERFHDK